jgi:CRISPR/Cas system-associated exonuclease Cas4 (RecB family)
MAQAKSITAWSFSRLKDYEQCPAKAKYKHVDKLKEPGNAAMDRGTAIHKLAEDFVKGDIMKLPPELQNFKKEFEKVRKQNQVFVEEQLTFDSNLKLMKDTKEQQAWFSYKAWLRVKMDLRVLEKNIMRLIDHKTGRVNEEHKEQLELYALIGFMLEPEIDIIDAELWYLDNATKPVAVRFLRKNFAKIKKKWLLRVKPMMVDTLFAPRPGRYCSWCWFNKNTVTNKGEPKPKGPCKFG